MDDVAPGYAAVGRVLSPWGLHGDLKVEPLTDRPDYFAPGRSITIAGQTRIVEHSHPRGRLLYLKLSGIDDRNAAEALRGQLLQVPESDLEPLGEDQYYRFQLIGLSVRSTTGEPLGHVCRILSTPSNDVFVVHGPRGEILIPAIEDIVKEIDIERSTIIVEVVPGLLQERKEGPRQPRSP